MCNVIIESKHDLKATQGMNEKGFVRKTELT